MKSYKFYNQHGNMQADENIAHGGVYASAVDFSDAIHQAETGKELLRNLKQLRLVGFLNPAIDYETTKKVRLRFNDAMGNIRYIEAEKERKSSLIYYRIELGIKDYSHIKEYLSMNGYKCTFVDAEKALFVPEDEVIEVTTIIDDERICGNGE